MKAFVTGATTDHLTPWTGCYRTTQLLSGPSTFVLSSSGHIQSIVNPPANPKAKYFLNDTLPADAEAWIAGATEHQGSWWDHWSRWYRQHGGGEMPAPQAPGNERHPAGDPAPGRYVHQR